MVLVFEGWICARRSGLVNDDNRHCTLGTAMNLVVDGMANDGGRIL